MKTLKPLIIGISIMLSNKAATAATDLTEITPIKNSIAVELTDIDVTRGGNLIVFIFGKDGFPKKHEKALAQQTSPVSTKEMTFHFDIDEDEVAVKILHDEDEDGKVTKNWTGIFPKEGLGFSNNRKIGFTGPPNFKKAHVTSAQFSQMTPIKLRYPRRRKSK